MQSRNNTHHWAVIERDGSLLPLNHEGPAYEWEGLLGQLDAMKVVGEER